MRRALFPTTAALATALALPVAAQEEEVEETESAVEEAEQFTAISLGLGITEFAGESMDDVTDVGGALDLRFIFGSGRVVGFEVAYFGTRQSVDILGLEDDAALVSHAGEASARFDISDFFDLKVSDVELLPFLTVGAMVGRYNLDADGRTAAMSDSDNVLFIPASAGLAAAFERWLFDARFTWRHSFDEDLLRTASGQASDATLNNWNVMARAGVEF